ncbi:TetR/AcrR family transcriptional regulator C-terminal domain-containing protein [Myxococcus sp. RHSTA-1-4]|uniref:TetR/AcrR family transcriptional regulator C-terminal domain-containing protein n=1 Tax=Myxococcus sp. RHSTA-1-4 TaxID=2874601 RepID=UPI001CBAFA3F|nr:TetR/AcrR family transcriptional regulator C-terminal domain-containing protein [Myxococcus sp. RHSTA-1-4]MBZ4418128.1 TetR/AcrR family transcriptional regulator C-terminal domain-containing protein [Myxococcus sp. RHSTA-1-4]
MSRAVKKRARAPLTRERVLLTALSIADARGLDAVTMREVAQRLGVEAMSLYKHVANKDEILDGLIELVMSEMVVPSPESGWKAGLRAKARSMREVLLRHRWAAVLIESRVSPGPARLRLHNAGLRVLREGGFSVEQAYSAYLMLDSYIYGFVLQEVCWPFEPEERPDVAESLRPAIPPDEYPYLVEAMNFVMTRSLEQARRGVNSAASYAAEFEFGLDVILDGLERASSVS